MPAVDLAGGVRRIAQWLASKPADRREEAQIAVELAFAESRDIDAAIREADEFLAEGGASSASDAGVHRPEPGVAQPEESDDDGA